MALTFVLGWEAHALWSKWGADDEHTRRKLEDKDEDSGIFSEEGQSMLSEKPKSFTGYQIKQGDTFFVGTERYGVRFPIKTGRECAEHFDISKIRVGQAFVIEQHGDHKAH